MISLTQFEATLGDLQRAATVSDSIAVQVCAVSELYRWKSLPNGELEQWRVLTKALKGLPVGTVVRLKGIIGEDVRRMLRLTRALLKPSCDARKIGGELGAVMRPLAQRIRAAGSPPAMRAVIDEIIVEDMRARYASAEFSKT